MSKSENTSYVVDGFSFSSEAEWEHAKKELEGIKYVRGKLDMDHPEQVLQFYNKMVDEKLFVTAVGMAYLADLREYLMSIPYISDEEIHPIYVAHPAVDAAIKEQKQIQKEKVEEVKNTAKKAVTAATNGSVERKFQISFFLNIILAVCVLLMFAISATSSHPNILNYETELVNRYSVWEQELTEREAAIREWEANH